MKKCMVALGFLMISFVVSACSNKGDSTASFTVGGVVNGSTGELVLQNNGGDDLTISVNGPFTFPTALASGSSYSVTVRTNPAGQTCVVSNGTGAILVSNVTNVSVDCSKRGGLDPTFNSPNGFSVQGNAAGGNGDDLGNAVAIDSQERMLVTGSSTSMGGTTTDMVVWRFNANGTLDTTFNGSGIVVRDNTAGGNGDDSGRAIAIDSDGGILVTGSSTTAGGTTDMVVWRFNADGTLDTAFNGSGIVSVASGTGDASGNAIAIDSQGKVLVTGSSTTAGGTTDMVIWRFNPNGTIDTSFNKSGIIPGMVVHNNAAGGDDNDSGNAIAIDSNGRILVAGSSTNSAGNTDMVVWRFKVDGTLDTSFNSTGILVHNNAAGGNGDDSGNAIALDAQGRILVAGSSKNNLVPGNTDMVIWRLTSTGALDTTFNVIGIFIDNGAAGSNGDDSGNAVAVDSQGRIIATGSSTNRTGNKDMVVWRLTSTGALDTTFAVDGIMVHDSAAGGNGDDSGNAAAIDSQDRILVTGNSTNGSGNKDMAIWRVFP
jgi:uncharacterized delta-60 repeat protein